jgi:hypothetical protein
MDLAVVGMNDGPQRLEVERAQSPTGEGMSAIMRDANLSIDPVNIGLDAHEALIEGVKERSLMFIVIVGVSLS